MAAEGSIRSRLSSGYNAQPSGIGRASVNLAEKNKDASSWYGSVCLLCLMEYINSRAVVRRRGGAGGGGTVHNYTNKP